MAASVFSSELYSRLFPAGEAGKLFTDSAEVRAMLLVEGTLAKVQGEMGLIPAESAAFIHRASLEIPLDPGGLAEATGTNGVTVPGLVAAFRKEMQAPEHAQYVHWGATSQDISETAQMLRLRQFLNILSANLTETAQSLGKLAETHADLPMPGRTYGQHATPISFGATAAHWGAPLLDLLAELPALRDRALLVSLSGAAGTGSAFGPRAAELRAAFAKSLNLKDPQRSWHADRGPILAITGWLSRLATALGKMGEDLILFTQTGISEVTLGASGGSSTMPQKQNPVQPSAMVALSRQVIGLNTILQGAGLHRQDRDGAAWFTEWLTLPQLCLATASALEHGRALAASIAPNPAAMQTALSSTLDLLYAEALSFRLAEHLPRPEAQAAIKTLCKQSLAEDTPLSTLARAAYPDLPLDDIFDPARQTGQAPAEARAFAAATRAL
ncbi:adenylosuccinate lyase family protein [Thalassobius vesicularis]|uniref:Adenylosuccinate lyase family protein n=1 Tax=Thalassobius vesicularis TaxID=1294297 RepID=A0A4S3M736_9RHOB|nr:adenylosuccinate lyase family protein [Thalassobius vesicularis]THD72991.1 adenylosuccinate lyase family protein [Thalassobius vesicularis]